MPQIIFLPVYPLAAFVGRAASCLAAVLLCMAVVTPAHAVNEAAPLCAGTGHALRLAVMGKFRDYPLTSVEEVVRTSFVCPAPETLKASCFRKDPLSVKIFVVQAGGQGQVDGHATATLQAGTEDIRSARISLSPLAGSQPPSAIAGDMRRLMKQLWAACSPEASDR